MATADQNTLSGEPLKSVGGEEPASASTTPSASAVKEVAEAKDPSRIPAATQRSALDWFISGEPMGGKDGDLTTLRVNVGSLEGEPEWIDWTVKPIELEQLRAIRKRSSNTREARRTGQIDEFRVNLEIVAVSTVEPAMAEIGKLTGEDPIEALRKRFSSRPGFIMQVATKVLSASGFDEEDVQDSTQVLAAGNS